MSFAPQTTICTPRAAQASVEYRSFGGGARQFDWRAYSNTWRLT
jgi:hypothetical protein